MRRAVSVLCSLAVLCSGLLSSPVLTRADDPTDGVNPQGWYGDYTTTVDYHNFSLDYDNSYSLITTWHFNGPRAPVLVDVFRASLDWRFAEFNCIVKITTIGKIDKHGLAATPGDSLIVTSPLGDGVPPGPLGGPYRVGAAMQVSTFGDVLTTVEEVSDPLDQCSDTSSTSTFQVQIGAADGYPVPDGVAEPGWRSLTGTASSHVTDLGFTLTRGASWNLTKTPGPDAIDDSYGRELAAGPEPSYILPVLDNDVGDGIQITAAGGDGGTWIANEGELVFFPFSNVPGEYHATYTITDANGLTDSANVTLTLADCAAVIVTADATKVESKAHYEHTVKVCDTGSSVVAVDGHLATQLTQPGMLANIVLNAVSTIIKVPIGYEWNWRDLDVSGPDASSTFEGCVTIGVASEAHSEGLVQHQATRLEKFFGSGFVEAFFESLSDQTIHCWPILSVETSVAGGAARSYQVTVDISEFNPPSSDIVFWKSSVNAVPGRCGVSTGCQALDTLTWTCSDPGALIDPRPIASWVCKQD